MNDTNGIRDPAGNVVLDSGSHINGRALSGRGERRRARGPLERVVSWLGPGEGARHPPAIWGRTKTSLSGAMGSWSVSW